MKYKRIFDKGDAFGNLIVMEVDPLKKAKADGSPNKISRWSYICSCTLCGSITSVPRESLTTRGKTSCGCISNKHNKYLKPNEVFGDLTVISVDEASKVSPNGDRKPPVKWKYFCKCKCGKTRIVVKDKLIHKLVTNCGCKKWNTIKLNKIEECGDVIKLYLTNSPHNNFTLIDRENYCKVKNYCWHETTNGYARTMGRKKFEDLNIPTDFYGGESFSLHNYLVGRYKAYDVDHKNKNRLDNRKSNLRKSSRSENLSNRGDIGNGVDFDVCRQKWKASIGIDNKNVFLGRFKNMKDAIEARKKAEQKYFGNYAPNKYPYKTLETILTELGFPHKERI